MRSSGNFEDGGWVPPPVPDVSLICADDLYDSDFVDFAAGPLTVAETLLEVSLAGTGPEGLRLLETLTDRALTPDEALAVAAAWERQARWVSARQHAVNVGFVGAAVATGRDGERAQSSRGLG